MPSFEINLDVFEVKCRCVADFEATVEVFLVSTKMVQSDVLVGSRYAVGRNGSIQCAPRDFGRCVSEAMDDTLKNFFDDWTASRSYSFDIAPPRTRPAWLCRANDGGLACPAILLFMRSRRRSSRSSWRRRSAGRRRSHGNTSWATPRPGRRPTPRPDVSQTSTSVAEASGSRTSTPDARKPCREEVAVHASSSRTDEPARGEILRRGCATGRTASASRWL